MCCKCYLTSWGKRPGRVPKALDLKIMNQDKITAAAYIFEEANGNQLDDYQNNMVIAADLLEFASTSI